jgi:DNA-binding HxlR family transcriptional regulator
MPTDAGFNATCTIARSLDVLGPRWNLLILREAVNGVTRFADFRQLLGIAPDVLSDRLAALVEAGIFEKRPYRTPGERPRDEYVLTERGRELRVVLAALQDWGDKYASSEFGPTTVRRRRDDDEEVHVAFVDARGNTVAADEVYSQPQAGTPAEQFYARRRELVEQSK